MGKLLTAKSRQTIHLAFSLDWEHERLASRSIWRIASLELYDRNRKAHAADT